MKQTKLWIRVLVVCCLSGVRVAMAAPPSEDTQLCVAASTQGQTDRDEGRLLAAREEFLACAREVCPAIVRKSCGQWLSELVGRIPSVVVRVQEAGQHDVTDARVTLDGRAVNLDGRPLPLDPGTHAVEVDTREGQSLERSFLIAEREQGRLLVVDLPLRAPEPAAPEPEAVIPRHAEPAAVSFSVPTAGWMLGGVGVLGVATFSVLRVQLGSELRELERTCSPNCTDRQRDAGKQKALLADISLGVGIAALAGGVAWTVGSWLVQRSDRTEEPGLAFSLVPTAGGAFASLAARY